MRSDPSFLTINQITDAAITGVGNDRLNFFVGGVFMGLDEALQLAGFIHRTGSGLYGGDHCVGIINHSISLLAQPALLTTVAYPGRIGIRRTAKLSGGFGVFTHCWAATAITL